jgi:hypothetical protein
VLLRVEIAEDQGNLFSVGMTSSEDNTGVYNQCPGGDWHWRKMTHSEKDRIEYKNTFLLCSHDRKSGNMKQSVWGETIRSYKGLKREFSFYSFIHMSIHCLGHFCPLPPPSLQAEPVLPLSLILLKRRHKQ